MKKYEKIVAIQGDSIKTINAKTKEKYDFLHLDMWDHLHLERVWGLCCWLCFFWGWVHLRLRKIEFCVGTAFALAVLLALQS